MPDTRITASSLKDEVIRVAAEKPEHIYRPKNPHASSACTYTQNGKPACIVGHALNRLGVDTPALQEFDSHAEGGLSVDELFYHYFHIFDDGGWDDESVQFLSRVQSFQDGGMPWGEAVLRAHAS